MNNSKTQPFILILISFLVLLLVAPSHLSLLTWSDQGLVRASSTASGFTLPEASPVDMDHDGQPEDVILQEGKVEIRSRGIPQWSSPSDWEIVQAEVTDLNRDGESEVALLLWREFAPWPIDAYIPYPGRIQDFHNKENRSCHLILIGWSRGAYREIWAGSALVDPLLAFTSGDINQDGYQELIALESRYDAHALESNTLTVWEWNGFGFTLLSRSPKGYFHSITLVRTSTGQTFLLTQGILRR